MDIADNFWSRVGVPGTPIRAPFRPRSTLGYRLFCNREPPPLPAPGNPGQCPGQQLRIFYQASFLSPSQDCQRVVVNGNTGGTAGYFAPVTPLGVRTQGITSQLLVRHATDATATQFTESSVFNSSGAQCSPGNGLQGTITGFEVLTGQGIQCPDEPLTPPVPIPNPTIPDDVEYEDDNGDPVSVPVNITFGFPFIFINGELNVPFRVQISPELNFDIDGTLNLETGDVNFNFGGAPGGDGCLPKPPGDFTPIGDGPPAPDPGVPQPSPIDDDPTDDRLKDIIRGVIVTSSVNDVNATIIGQSGNPNLYVPRIGNVQFAIQIRNSVSWTERVNVTNLRQFIPCPWEGGAIDVRGTAEPGVIMSLTPVIGQVSERVMYEV